MVFEQLGARKSTVDFTRGECLGVKDHLLQLTRPKRKPHWMTEEEYEDHPESLYIREVKVAGKVPITNLTSPQVTSKAYLKALYKKRWNVEVDLRNIKHTLGMGVLRCKTPAMNEKEIWVYFLAYNLIRLLMVQAAIHSRLLPRQLSFKHSLQLGLACSNNVNANAQPIKNTNLFVLIAQRIVGNRPGRVEPRAVKRRLKPSPLLMQNRHSVQKEIRENGHSKKLK